MIRYNLLYTKTAFKDVQKLDTVTRKRIKKKIETYQKNPIESGKKLIDPSIGTYRWRIGNHRVIFDIDKENIVILRIGHRREIYKK